MTKTTNFFKMAVLMLLFCLSGISLYSQTDADPYCTANNGCGTYITNVTIGTLVNNGTSCSTNGYGNYITMTYAAVVGSTFNISVTGSGTTSSTELKIFIDWNRDYDLTDAGESITVTGSPGVGPYTASVTIPMNSYIGKTRIRVRIGNNPVNPCTYAAVGETEDYSLNILPPIEVVSISPSIMCVGSQVDVNYTASITFNPGNVFTLQLSDDYGSFSSFTELGTLTSTGSGVISATIPNSLFFGNAYRLRIVSSNPVYTSLDNGTDLIVSTPPNLFVVDPPAVCAPNTVDITTTWVDSNFMNTVATYWTDEACTIPVADPVAVTTAGTYYIKGVEQDGGCSDVAPVVVNIMTVVVDAGSDQSIVAGSSTQLLASVSQGTPPYLYSWTPVDYLSNPAILQPMATPTSTITYTLNVSDNAGCTGSDQVTVTVGNYGTVQGTVTYKNTASTAMTNTTVYLKNLSGVVLYTTTTDATGHFAFTGVDEQSYLLTASCQKPWGGGNAVDALQIMRHFVAMIQLTGLNKTAADLDGSNIINSIDALLVMKRFVNMISSFVVGNWRFEQFTVNVTAGQTVNQNIKALCSGDVDGSNVPGLTQ